MDGSFSCKDDNNSSGSGSGGAGGSFLNEQEEPNCSPPDQYVAGPSTAGGPPPDNKPSPTSTALGRAAPATSSSPKRSGGRRPVHKRAVSVPIPDANGARRGKGSGEGSAPASDSWAWRKYGQKPIKGSPYPRGYYRCSSSKGCPARKQVERSRTDPTMLVITYAWEHNHPWPVPKQNNHQHQLQQQKQPSPAAAAAPASPSKPTSPDDAPGVPGPPLTSSPEESFATDLLGEDTSLAMMADDFGWFSDVSASPPAAETFLGGVDGSAMMPTAIQDDDVEFDSAGDGDGGEESSLFAGLGELPECAVVFRRAFLERQVRMQMVVEEDRRAWRRQLLAAAAPGEGGGRERDAVDGGEMTAAIKE